MSLVTIDVDTGEVSVSTTEVILQSIALGSCVAVAVYDSKRKIGGLAHVMLPGKAPSTNRNTKYTEDAIDQLLDRMKKSGASLEDLAVSIVGGGNVLKEGDIPDRVIESVVGYLATSNVELRYMRVGGVTRQSVYLDTTSGEVHYTEGDDNTKTLLTKYERI